MERGGQRRFASAMVVRSRRSGSSSQVEKMFLALGIKKMCAGGRGLGPIGPELPYLGNDR